MKAVAIVTGASSGLGAEFARLIAQRPGIEEVWLVARRADRLEALAAEISASPGRAGARAVPVQADLSLPAGTAALRARLEAERPALKLVVLNAGLGRYGRFDDSGTEVSLGMIDLNVRALTETARDVLPFLASGSAPGPGGSSGSGGAPGMILVASLAGFGPFGELAVYSATKAYVLTLGLALRAELAGKGIGVTTLCPGPVATEFSAVASSGGLGPRSGSQAPGKIARACLADFDRGRALSFGHWSWRLAPFLVGLFPKAAFARLSMRFVSR
jgi:uncharacterized protein